MATVAAHQIILISSFAYSFGQGKVGDLKKLSGWVFYYSLSYFVSLQFREAMFLSLYIY